MGRGVPASQPQQMQGWGRIPNRIQHQEKNHAINLGERRGLTGGSSGEAATETTKQGRRASCPPPLIRRRCSRPLAPQGQRVVSVRLGPWTGYFQSPSRQFPGQELHSISYFVFVCDSQQIEEPPPVPEQPHAANCAIIKHT